jgi:flavocytochrome c
MTNPIDRERTALSRREALKTVGVAGSAVIAGIPLAEATILPAAATQVKADVIVVGTGLAGMSASLQAAELGAKVVILDKMPEELVGGSSKFSGGSIGVASADTPEAKEKFFKAVAARSLGKGNEVIMKVIAENSLDASNWLRKYGAKAPPPMPRPGLEGASVIYEPGMYRSMRVQILPLIREQVKKMGAVFHFDTKARQLILDNKAAVIGVRAETKDGLVDYMGKVVLATGGFAANKEMLEIYVGPDADEAWYRGNPGNTGDGHLMAKEIGAGLVRMGGTNTLVLGMVSKANPHAGNPSYILQFGLCINKKGERYTDEGQLYGHATPPLLSQPGQEAAIIFDQATLEERGAVEIMLKVYKDNNVPYLQADTIEDLAKKLGYPVEALVKTVNDYNAAVKDGKAMGANPPKSAFAMKIAEAPFYAFSELVPGITLTFGGITITERAEVTQADGRVIKGVFAAGECAGGVFHYEYHPVGLPCANALTMGRVAGRNAAMAAKG